MNYAHFIWLSLTFHVAAALRGCVHSATNSGFISVEDLSVVDLFFRLQNVCSVLMSSMTPTNVY